MSPNVVVVGSINMDLVVPVLAFPRAGETVLGQNLNTIPGGKGANQAVAAARQGATVALVGTVGDDSYGKTLLDTLKRAGVNTTAVRTVGGSSGVAFIGLTPDGENRIIVVPGANRTLTAEAIETYHALIAAADYVVLQLEIPLDTVAATIAIAQAHNTRVILNPSPVPAQGLRDDIVQGVDILVLNADEATTLTGMHSVKQAAATLQERGVQTVIVTRGAEGAWLLNADGLHTIAPFPVQAIDTTAAGDAFIGALVASLLEEESLQTATRRAAAAGALAVTRLGAQSSLPSRAAVEALLATAEGRAPVGYRTEWESIFTNARGEQFAMRPILPSDAPRLQQLFETLSPESIYRRFFTVRKEITDNEARDLATVDYRNTFAYVVTPAEDPNRLLGVARFAASPERTSAVEMAIVIADSYQGRGIGQQLFRRLAETARALEHRWMMVETQNDNQPMIELAQRAGYHTQTAYDGAFIQLWLDLNRQ